MTARIVDDNGKGKEQSHIFTLYKHILISLSSTDVPVGERGELWLKGPNVMKVIQGRKLTSVACWPFFLTIKGYINNPEATAECIDSEGYFHTGDIAVQDKNGHFYIVDRIKELIKFKGFQV